MSTPVRSRSLKRTASTTQPASGTTLNGLPGSFSDRTSDFLCPICFELIEEAHITRCGHTFCYSCISRALETFSRCPKCSTLINGPEHIFPNFLLNELVSKYKTRMKALEELGSGEGSERPGQTDNLRHFVASESENLTLPDVNVILELLTQRKHILEAETCVSQNRLLLSFLQQLLKQKEAQQLNLNKEVEFIKKDLNEVESILKEAELRKIEVVTPVVKEEVTEEQDESFNGGKQPSNFSTFSLRRRRMQAHFDDFVQCYLNLRAKDLLLGKSDKPEPVSVPAASSLDQFRENLVKFSRYNTLRPLATLNYSSDIFNNSMIVSSIEFDKDNEFFAIAGVTKRIKVFDYRTVIRDSVDMHYPMIEMLSNSKISCVSWNSYHKNLLASSDYEGSVIVWDVSTGQKTRTLQEHEKRCWSVDFSEVDSRLIASGSDDARVKLWSLNTERSVACIEAKANVCCVKFNPLSSHHLAFGSADHCVHYYDLRNLSQPHLSFRGHKKAVSYVKFLNKEEIVSASTDSHLKLWNINTPICLRSFLGHINEKNFVGLATDGDYIACGSENNSLYVYYKGLTKQLFSFKFDALRSVLDKDRKDEDINEFVSAVCWRQHSNVVVTANSQGIIKILELV